MTEAVLPAHDPDTGELLAAQPAEPSPAAKPPQATRQAPASADEIAEAVAEAKKHLAQAGGAGAFARDPYRIVLAALSVTLDVFPKVVRRIETAIFTEAERAALRRDVAAASKAGVVQGATETTAMLVAQARAKDRRSLALFLSASVVTVGLVGAGAFWAGQRSVKAETAAWIRAERAALALDQESIALPLAEARVWAHLIRSNPAVREALAQAQKRQNDGAGRPFGLVPMWLDHQRVPVAGR